MGKPATSRSLGSVAARGAVITTVGQGLRLAIQMVSIMVMARLLTPTDYGLVAMVMVIISLGEVFREFGLSAAAIQSPVLTKGQRNNLFWANAAIGVCLAAAAIALSGMVARFYSEPETAPITQALSLVFVFNGLSAQYRASLARAMRFRALIMIDVSAQAVGTLVGISTAFAGMGYWSLVSMQLTQVGFTLALVAVAAQWLPGLPRRGQHMREFWSYGWNLVGTQFLTFLTSNIDTLVVGRRFGVMPVGIYDRAYRLLTVPLSQLRNPSTTVALPILSRIQDDVDRFGAFLVRGQLVLGYTILPLLAFAGGAAEPLIQVCLGSGWDDAAPIFTLFAIGGALTTLAYVGYWVYLARGLTRRLLEYTLMSSSFRITSILVGSHWGVLGVAGAVALAPAVLWPLSLWWLSRVTSLPLRALWLGGARVSLVALTCGLVVRFSVDRLDTLPAIVLVAIGVLVAAAWYALLAVLPSVRADERAVLATVKLAVR